MNMHTSVAPRGWRQKPLWIAIVATLSTPVMAAEPSTQVNLDEVPVTGNPLGVASDDMVVPVSVMGGRELSLRRQGTLGETLNGIPGVTATQFGPNASRPIIRGLDGERVKIMQNGVGVLDASSLSFDHAVGINPLIIEQIDVVRGPAALLYGGSAMGGVVNAIDHRIPKESLDGYTGRAEARFGGPDNTRNGAAVVDVGNGQFAMHADIYSSETSDLTIPGYAVSKRKSQADGTPRENKGKLINSDALSNGGALGASWTFDTGYLGLSYADSNNNYGTVAEQSVRIDMQNKRLELAGELRALNGPIQKLKLRMAHTDYQHVELEDGAVGTTFKNRGMQGSLEATHVPLAGMNGVLGYQFQNTRFQALGEEAFVPGVVTQDQSLYVYEEVAIGQHKVTFGGRSGETTVNSADSDNFGAGQSQRFNPNSFALGGLYAINDQWNATFNLSHNERAPSYFELYANGAHIATGQFEVGSTQLKKERSNGIDAQLKWKSGGHSLTLGAYATKFKNFIGLFNTGNEVAVDGDLLPEAEFRAVPALFKGLELEGKFALNDAWALKVRGDYVHAKDTRNNDYLPRISPLRLGGGLDYHLGSWNARMDVLHAFKQNDVAENELKTDGYTNLSALLAYKIPGKYHVELFARANNLLNDEIREHASFLKDISPAGARSILLGARADF